MAKSKSFFGLRTGSTKSLTFQVYRGQQITKDRVTRVTNPRTTLQMEQRSKLPIVAAARSALKGLVDHSWEGVPYGEQSLRTFSSKNLSAGALKVYSYASPDAPSPGIAEYQVSQGSLRGFTVDASKDRVLFTLPIAGGDGKVVPALPKGTKGSTVLYHLMSYFANNKIDGLRAGQQLTFLTLNVPFYKTLNYVGGSNSGTYDVPVTQFAVARLIMPDVSKISDIETYHDDNDEFVLDSEITEEGGNSVVLMRADGFHINFFAAAQDKQFGFSSWSQPANKSSMSVASALIVSELVNNVWKRSTSNLIVGNGANNALVSKVFSFDQWASLYAPKQIVSSKYLNNGAEKTGINK